MVITQADLNEKVLTLINHEVRLAEVAAKLRRQNDPAAFIREQEVMMLQNLIASLRDYQIADDILTDTEIRQNYEMGLQISLNWPRSL